MKLARTLLVVSTIAVSLSNVAIAANQNTESISKFVGSESISPKQVAKLDSNFKTDTKLAASIGILSYTNFSDIMSKEDRATLLQVRSYWNDSKSDLWRVEEEARTRTILEMGVFNTKETLLKKLDSSRSLKNRYNDALSYVRSYKSYVLYKTYGPKATNKSELVQEARNNYYCAGVMTNASNYYNERFSASKQYAKLIADTLFDKGPQYKALDAINDEQAAAEIRNGIKDNINPGTKFSSFDSCFKTASNKFNIR